MSRGRKLDMTLVYCEEVYVRYSFVWPSKCVLFCFVIRLRGTSLEYLCARPFFVSAIVLPVSHSFIDLCLNPPAFRSLHDSIDFLDD